MTPTEAAAALAQLERTIGERLGVEVFDWSDQRVTDAEREDLYRLDGIAHCGDRP